MRSGRGHFDLERDGGWHDFRLVVNGLVTLFWRASVFAEAVELMRRHDYTVAGFEARRSESDDDLHRNVAALLGFPSYHGRNLGALNKCMRDVVNYEYGTSREATRWRWLSTATTLSPASVHGGPKLRYGPDAA